MRGAYACAHTGECVWVQGLEHLHPWQTGKGKADEGCESATAVTTGDRDRTRSSMQLAQIRFRPVVAFSSARLPQTETHRTDLLDLVNVPVARHQRSWPAVPPKE